MNAQSRPDILIAEGDGWLALNKPSGMSTHNDASGSTAGSEKIDALTLVEKWTGQKAYPIHRLDRETSGVLIFATSRERAAHFQNLIGSERAATKIYRAVLRGKLEGSGSWVFAISDKAEGRDQPAGKQQDRKDARTHFEVVRSNSFLSDVRIELLTGRQHQIRKHARLAKHGIVGDTRYGELSHARKMESIYGVSRLMLHAESLKLGTISVEAPLPEEFERFFETKGAI